MVQSLCSICLLICYLMAKCHMMCFGVPLLVLPPLTNNVI
ncbi:hypothetical protein POPTR_008G058700v4 [Populus trichocarpa]|uniref:Uncharacterized protein n=1 Tax=Populus trichocarpa TaxID=3694 RepID=A0ACC0SK32_POPTR|nr:hypothetical protein BDE02_08G052700 [Populus trichocarpa]KAI9389548.1 hypothetical protein POPTR_008G058700v4 [Populus trichocarpa]